MLRNTVVYALATLGLALSAAGQSPAQPQTQRSAGDSNSIDQPFLWEYAEEPYGYPTGTTYTAPDEAFSARFGSKPDVHHVPQAGTTTDLYLGSLKHRPDLASLLRVVVMQTPTLDSKEATRQFLMGSHKEFERSLHAKRNRLAIRDLTGTGGPMLLEYEIEYAMQDVRLTSTGFWAVSGGKIIRAASQYLPTLNAEEIAAARHFPTTVAFPAMDALSNTARHLNNAPSKHNAGPFQTVDLKGGIKISLPSNWQVLSESTRQTLDAARVAHEAASQGEPMDSNLPFAANLLGDGGQVLAMVNARHFPTMTQTQKDVRDLDGDGLQAFDDAAREELQSSLQRNGQALQWLGVRRMHISNLLALVVSYERLSADRRDKFCVQLFRIHDGPKSFTLTLSYRKSMTALLKPICDHVLHSLQIPKTSPTREDSEPKGNSK